MTASQQAKLSGLNNLNAISKLTGVSPQTLNNWYNKKPLLFKIVVAGCKALNG